jgi:hypothetical protein
MDCVHILLVLSKDEHWGGSLLQGTTHQTTRQLVNIQVMLVCWASHHCST